MKSTLFFLFLIFLTSQIAAQRVMSIKDFGAPGDGKGNDYVAFKKAAAHYNKQGGGVLKVPSGNYFIEEYGSRINNITDIKFTNLRNFKIIGNGTPIRLNSKFIRKKEVEQNGIYFSSLSEVIPFYLDTCAHVEIIGLNIDGGADLSLKENVAEGSYFLIFLINCRYVSLKNLILKNSLTDGLYIGGANLYNIIGQYLSLLNNSRQGMSVISLTKGLFTGCSFLDTGFNKYRSHHPGAGVDLEPEKPEDKVKNIQFINCNFENNIGSQIIMSSTQSVSDILITKCRIIAGKSLSPYQIIVAAQNVTIAENFIDCRVGSVYLNWLPSPSTTVSITDNDLRSKAFGILTTTSEEKIIIEGNKFEYYGDLLNEHYFPYIQNWKAIFNNNTVKIPKRKQKRSEFNSLVQNVIQSAGNKYTDEFGNSFISKVSFTNARKLNDN